MSLPALRDLIAKYFTLKDIDALCFDLSIEYEELPGTTRTEKAQSLILYCERCGQLPALINRCRQLRGNVNWPDAATLRPPADPNADKWQEEAQQIYTAAEKFLFPHIWSRDERKALLSDAFYPAHFGVLKRIKVDGAVDEFLPNCWRTLHQSVPDGSLNTRLLYTVRARYGHDQQQEIDNLITRWRRCCQALQVQKPTRSLPPGQLTPAAGHPTLFLSCHERDRAAAKRLAVVLDKYGYACQVQTVSRTDNAAWLEATATALGSALAVLLLVGRHSAGDRWQRLEYLAAADRQKPVIPLRLAKDAALPSYLAVSPLLAVRGEMSEETLTTLLTQLPRPETAGKQTWLDDTADLRPRLAELAYMDRLKLAELQHVARYTRLSGQTMRRRSASGRLWLEPVVARQEFHHAPWRRQPEMEVEARRFEDAVTELQAIRRAVLLGEPGSGKTTTFYKLAAGLIETAQTDPGAPIPLMAALGLWTAADEPFPDFLRRAVGELGDYLDGLLADGQAVLLLDGINEIPADQQTDKYRQVRDFLAQWPDLMAWVSCRQQDYPPERDLQLDQVTVAPLDAVRIREFCRNYLTSLPDFGPAAADDLFWQLAGEAARKQFNHFEQNVAKKVPDADKRFALFWLDDRLPDGVYWGWEFISKEDNSYWERWLKQRAQPTSLLRLAANPYMLFMLLDVYQTYRALPANRGQLFDQFVETLLVREGLLGRDPATKAAIPRPAGMALLAALAELAFALQTQRTGRDKEEAAGTVLPVAEAARYLTTEQQYQAVSANLLVIGGDVRFAHQLLQEYFAARALRQRVFGNHTQQLAAAAIWQPDKWWQPTNWEETAILLAGLYSDNCTPVLDWLADAQPELAARCIVESGAYTPEETKQSLRGQWLPRLANEKQEMDARARAAIGRALGRVTLADGLPLDNRPGVGVNPETGLPDIAWGGEVPPGRYWIGGDKDAYGSFDRQQVTIPHAYRLAKYPITNAQFQCFLDAPDRDDETWWKGIPADEKQFRNPYWPYANHPREMVSWYQAMAFCRWLTTKLHAGLLPMRELSGRPEAYIISLPHEYEWEVAACWPNESAAERLYPWGREFDAAKANTDEGGIGQTTPVGMYPSGRNEALDVYDLSGNVWEWCRNLYHKPESELDLEEVDVRTSDWRVLRGGSFYDDRDFARAASRSLNFPDYRNGNNGFRVVVVRRSPSHQ